MLVDQLARAIVNSGTAGQSHAVSIVIDHIRRRTDNANADDSLGKISESTRGETVTKDEGIEPIQATKLIERDFTGTCRFSRVNSGIHLVEAFQEENCLLDPICLRRTRRSTEEFPDGTFDQASQTLCNLASHKIVDDVSHEFTKSALFG